VTITIRDAFPVSLGHTLVIPRRHFASLFDATPEDIREIWQPVREAAEQLADEVRPDGFNVGVNVGEAVGQTVMHLHVHVIPRCAGVQPDPRGRIRRIFPNLADYWSEEQR
jgi:diadenosine tetraphosphate (Ap4A) HIT family hydrolase